MTEQSYMFAAPRLRSVSPRSKQYSHCASAFALPSARYGEPAGSGVPFGVVGSTAVSSAPGIWPEMTDIDECSWPATTLSMPMNSGRLFSALKYSTSGYWNCWIDCHRHMLRFGVVPETSPCGVTPEASQVVFGLRPEMNG